MEENGLSYDLSYKIIPEGVTVSTVQSLRLCITNYSGHPIKFMNPDGIKGEEIPTDFEKARSLKVTHFLVYFYYGDRSGDLVSVDDSKNLSFSWYGGEDWCVSSATDSQKGVCCKINPRRNIDLPDRESIIISIDRIKCNPKTGITRLNIELRTDEITHFNLDIMKYAKPVICSFGIEESDITLGQEITYCWKTDGDAGCAYAFDGAVLPATEQAERKHKITADTVQHSLTMTNPAGYPVKAYHTPTYRLIDDFSILRGSEDAIYLNWRTRSTQYCTLTDKTEELPVSGTCYYAVYKDKDICLKARMKTSTVEESRCLTFRIPCFKTLTAKRVERADPGVCSGFVPLEELNQVVPAVAVVVPPYAGPGPPHPPGPKPPPKPNIYVQVTWELERGDACIINGTAYARAGETTLWVSGYESVIHVYAAFDSGYQKSYYVKIEQ